jgi:membrane associated rhomboid family serine protease
MGPVSELSPTGPGAVEKPSMSEPFRPLLVVVALLVVMWAAEIIDLVPGTPFDRWGIRPRTVRGVAGIPMAPFLHSGFGHLFANTIPFLVLGAFIALGDLRRFVQVTVIVGLTSGLGTWLFASPGTIHIGASGLVFGYLTYLIARGFFAAKPLWILGGIVIGLLYGGLLWGLLPRPGISFTGHLFGAAGGVLAAFALHGKHTREEGLTDASRPRIGP